MIVVADSGPLNYLVLLNEADLLPRLYGQVLIPPAVVRELSSSGTPARVAAWLSNPPQWLRIEPVAPAMLQRVSHDLDPGEREAIALAEAAKADLLLLDDLVARTEARRLGLRVTGTLGVLRAAAERGFIDVPTVIGRLRETSFYIDERLIRSVFAQWLHSENDPRV